MFLLVRQSQVANFAVRYFTPAEEIPLAGHPTIATTVALLKSGRLQVNVEVIGPPAAIETVKVGGSAVVVLQGELML